MPTIKLGTHWRISESWIDKLTDGRITLLPGMKSGKD
jgi:hypothetical protein